MEILLYQHGQSALDTSRTLFLLASTRGASYRLVMNHLATVSLKVASRKRKRKCTLKSYDRFTNS